MAKPLSYKASVVGKDLIHGGTQCKVVLDCTKSGFSRQGATSVLTELKKDLNGVGYEVIRKSFSKSFLPDDDGEKTIEVTDAGRCLSVLFTHTDPNLSDAAFASDVASSFNKEGASMEANGEDLGLAVVDQDGNVYLLTPELLGDTPEGAREFFRGFDRSSLPTVGEAKMRAATQRFRRGLDKLKN